MTSALYPYVHTLARGTSGTKYSSGQKTSNVVGGFGVPVSAGLALVFRKPENRFEALSLARGVAARLRLCAGICVRGSRPGVSRVPSKTMDEYDTERSLKQKA